MTGVRIFSLALLLAQGSFGATLIGDTVTAAPGQQAVATPVSMYNCVDDEVAALFFDLTFDDAVLALADVVIGESAAAAGKQLSYTILSQNSVRIVVFGFNQSVIADGRIAYPQFDVAEGAPSGTYALVLSNPLLSDPFGIPVEGATESGAVVIGGGTKASLKSGLMETVYVDFSHDGLERGTACHPANSVSEGVALVAAGGSLLFSAPGESTERICIASPMALHVTLGAVRIGVAGGLKSPQGEDPPGAETSLAASPLMKSLVRSTLSLSTAPSASADAEGGRFFPHQPVYEPALPARNLPDGQRVARPDEVLALRLRADAPMRPESIRATIEADNAEFVAEWAAADEGNATDDIWVLYRPVGEWRDGASISVAADALTETGNNVCTQVFTYLIAREALDALGGEGVDALPWWSGIPRQIGPDQFYSSPRWVWLPLPREILLDDAHLYYYHRHGADRGWYIGQHVLGWLVAGSQRHRISNGVTEIGFQAHHGALVQVGGPPR